jgi:chaperonin GroES
MPRVHPRNDRVLVKILDTQGITKGGILLPDAAKDRPCKGLIVEIGPGRLDHYDRQRVPMGLAVGDVVLFPAYAGSSVPPECCTAYILKKEEKVKGKEPEFRMMVESDILAKVEAPDDVG